MKKILVLLVALLMVGCEAKEQEKPKQIIKEAVKQEQQVDEPKEEVKEAQEEVKQVEKELPKKTEPKKEEPKKTVKESPKKEEPKKKEQDDNIDPETGLAKIKDGTHLEEEAKKQEEDDSIWTKDYCPECGKPIDDCICDGDGYTNSNLNDVQEYQCSNCGDYYRQGSQHTCTSQYTDYEGNTAVETWKNGQMVDTTTIYNNDAEPDEFNNEDTEEY